MALVCNCDDPRNSGIPVGSRGVIGLGQQIFIVPLVADDGTTNQILETDFVNGALPASYFSDKVNNLDPSKRWYPIAGEYVNETSERADPNTESFNDGSTAITTQGVRTYEVKLLGVAPHYLMNIATLACNGLGVYILDACDDLAGQICRDGGGVGVDSIKPIPINKNHFDTTVAFLQQDAVAGGVRLRFEFSQTFRDKEFIKLTRSELGSDLRALTGLVDMTGTFSSITTTGFTVVYSWTFDKFFEEGVTGGVLADFEVFNVTQGATVTLTSVTPTANSYVVVMPAQASSDVLRVRTLIGGFFDESTITIA